MEIIGDDAHRMLAYVEAVNRQGYHLTVKEFEAYASGWEPTVTMVGGGSELGKSLSNLQRVAAWAFYGDAQRETEPMIDYLCRLMWLSKRAGRVQITDLGKAVLREANSPLPDSDTGSTLEVVIDPDNPFAYAQLMAKITGFEECMIVDPYLDVDQLITLAGFGSVTRILTGNGKLKRLKPMYELVLHKAPHLDVRWMQQSELHDRYAIPVSGHVYMLGSSLNSIANRFGVATTFESSTSKLIAAQYDSRWGSATPLLTEAERGAAGGAGLQITGVAGPVSEDPDLPTSPTQEPEVP